MSKKTALLYNGEVEIVFDEARHMYSWQGKPIAGVTSILARLNKPALVAWAANQAADHILKNWVDGCDLEKLCKEAKGAHRRLSKDAADVGSEVHAYAEAMLTGVQPPQHSQLAVPGCRAFDEWACSHNVEPIACERIIFSREDWYCGTADLFGYVDGRLTVGDFKTSSGVYPEMLLQTAAYIRAIEEETGERVEQRIIIRLDKKTGKFEAHTFPYSERDVQCFRLMVQVDKFLKGLEQEMSQKAA